MTDTTLPTATGRPLPFHTAPGTAHRRAIDRLLTEQQGDGCWEGEMVGNTAALSQYVIVARVIGRMPDHAEREAMIRHYRTTEVPGGGWALHPEAPASMYCTALGYVALRLLGMGATDSLCARSARWMRAQPEGVTAIPTWGKFWLALAGLYSHRGVNPVPPELFLAPRRLPLHPNRLQCHARSLYQAAAYLHGRRFAADLGPLGARLRCELFGTDAMPTARRAAGPDVRVPPGRLLRTAHAAARLYERRPARRRRERALEVCYRRVEHEQRTTRDMGLTPGSALLNVLVLHDRRPGSLAVRRAFEAQAYWRWSDVDGVRFASGRTQTRDTAFAVEALLTDDRIVTQAALVRATAFLWGARLTEEVPDPEVTARAAARGGWCASEGGHRWPVSDCTAEALTALLYAAPRGDRHREAAVREAAAFLLRRQNRDGGFGAYERRRAPRLLDALNPTEMFTDCVVEGSYVESTGSALVGLAAACGAVEPPVVRRARRRAVRFLLRHQAADGSWPAARGVHRLHGTWCAVRGLRAAGLPTTHDALRRAAEWLRSVQRADGGWGEHHSGCLEGRYVEHSESQPVSTAWAVLALLDAEGPQDAAAERGVRWLCRWQGEDGTWEQSAVTGVLFGTVMLDLRLSARHFPAWALGRWLREAGPSIRP